MDDYRTPLRRQGTVNYRQFVWGLPKVDGLQMYAWSGVSAGSDHDSALMGACRDTGGVPDAKTGEEPSPSHS